MASVIEESEAVAAAKAEAADWQDKYVRLHAEWDTYRRRMAEQREVEKARATEKLMESLLPVLDDFVRTVDYAETNGETGLLGGVKAVQAKLIDTLAKGGLEVINPEGEAFDALPGRGHGGRPQRSRRDRRPGIPTRIPHGRQGAQARHGDHHHRRPQAGEAGRRVRLIGGGLAGPLSCSRDKSNGGGTNGVHA